jgi:hypothetical protein
MNPDGSGAKLVTASFGPDPVNDSSPAWSPDNSGLAFTSDRDGNSTVGLYLGALSSTDGTVPDPRFVTYAAANPSWSGYLARTPKKLVGSGGLMASAAAGFLFAQAGGAFAGSQPERSRVSSVVTFDASVAANRVNARVEKLSEFGGSNVVLSITDGDATLNNLRYLNSADDKVIQAVGTSAVPSAAGILVSFDGADGSVAAVVPYNATKAAGNIAMKPSREGDALVFRGSFAGVWDGKGENVAPGGAHVVRIDARTGRLIQAQ